MTSGVVETKLLGLSQGHAPAIFQYGGLVEGGVGSRTLWVGLPEDPDRRWLTGMQIWGESAMKGPPVYDGAVLVYDERGSRLVVLGTYSVEMGPRDSTNLRHSLWTFDLRRGCPHRSEWDPLSTAW
jgi:hypothetical protein